MANRMFNQFQLSLVKNRVSLFATIPIGVAGAVQPLVQVDNLGIASVVRNSVGNYTITFGYYVATAARLNLDTYGRLLYAAATLLMPGVPPELIMMSVVEDLTHQGQIIVQFSAAGVVASPLLSAAGFAVLASSAISNTGSSVISGELGIYPGTSVAGFPPGVITGAEHINDAAAQQALVDAQAAFSALQVLGLAGTVIPSALDGQTLVPGAYQFASGAATLAASGAGTLTLNGPGQYVIYTASTLTTGAGGIPTIALTNGALASDVFFVVGSSATINSGHAGVLNGNIIADVSITNTLGGTVNGNLIALTGAVTLSAASVLNSPVLPSGVAAVDPPVGSTVLMDIELYN